MRLNQKGTKNGLRRAVLSVFVAGLAVFSPRLASVAYGAGGGSTVVHVWAGAPGGQTGADWQNAFHTIDQAVAAAGASAYEQMWVAGSLSHAELLNTWAREADILVLGGFSGTENAPGDRAAGAFSTIDGGDAAPAFQFENTAGTITFRDFAFTRTKKGALRKTGGAGHVCVTNCLFYGNRSSAGNATGNCLHLVGASGQLSEVSVSDCRMEGNAVDAYVAGIAVTIYANTLKRLTLDSCTFVTNTASIKCGTGNQCPGRDALKGSEIYAIAAPVTARDCKFLVNRGCTHKNAGGNIRLEGLSAPSAFTNCLFAGNSCQYSGRDWDGTSVNTTNMSGTVLVNLANASDTVDFANCTFAYNVTSGRCAPGALEVNKGCVNVVNSIFYGNVKATKSTAGRDIDAQVGQASVTVSYSAFEGLGSDFLTGPITIGEGVFACNPLFVTPYATVSAVIETSTYDNDIGCVYYKNTAAAVGVLSALDLHLRSVAGYSLNDGTRTMDPEVTSPAIDKGDPVSPWEKEPDPNGSRVNLGCYGNTTEASATLVSDKPSLSPDDVAVDFPDGYSLPVVSFALSGDDTAKFEATVIVEFITNGLVLATQTTEGVVKGQLVTSRTSFGLIAGDTLTVRVTAKTDGNDDVVVEKSVVVTGVLPPGQGKGGGSKVVHVWAEARGGQTGEDWLNAFHTIDQAVVAAKASAYEQMWVAGSLSHSELLESWAREADILVLGGFSGTEDAPGDRAAGAFSTIDGGDAAPAFQFENTAGTITFRDFAFTRTKRGALRKTGGAGHVCVTNCQFYGNRSDGGERDGQLPSPRRRQRSARRGVRERLPDGGECRC